MGPSRPEGIPPGAKLVDPDELPEEIASDPALLKELHSKGMLQAKEGGGGGVLKMQQTPKGSEKVPALHHPHHIHGLLIFDQHLSFQGRHAFQHDGQTIYEWEQSLDEVNIWIRPPPGVTAQHLDIVITHEALRVGIKGNPPFLSEEAGGEVVVSESFWSLDSSDGEITINMQKMRKGQMWVSALKGHAELDPLAKVRLHRLSVTQHQDC